MYNRPAYFIFLLCFKFISCYQCGQAEYKISDECCPMCSPGSRVYRHCTAYTSTSCVPCIGPTFTNQPNGVEECQSCTVCVQALRLKTVKVCTSSSDTVCGVLEGHYCIDADHGGCRVAQRHTACTPGQFIKRPGTESTDTVCKDCGDNSYSNGSFTSCKPHTDCESKGLPTVKPGDRSSDSVCGVKNWAPVIVGSIAGTVVLAAAATAVTYLLWRRKKKFTDSGKQNLKIRAEMKVMVPEAEGTREDTDTSRGLSDNALLTVEAL